ncbi:3'(2'),5'-bisphosphate nucleotidase CysQ [Motiliproteus sp.]|uniref:3'(2'),5'-bisphosphate nucleotidase CysQ n=1 Tax=Motiliproteus sp. TaxID=1898955 RepID=UPI003BA86637
MDFTALLPQLTRIAVEAGEAILSIYDRDHPVQVQHKADTSPLTEADLAAHRLICSSLERLCPEIPILSEESAVSQIAERQQWSRYWLVDPLDGTKEFIKRNGEFTVNIALIDNHQPLLGVVYAPAIDTLYAGCDKVGIAYKSNGKGLRQLPLKSRPLAPFRPLSLVVSRSHRDSALDPYIDRLRQILPVSETPMGSSLKLCLIAEGAADLHLRTGPTSEWDTAAAQAVLEAAGGQVIDFRGRAMRYNERDNLINPDFIATGDRAFDWSHCLGLES